MPKLLSLLLCFAMVFSLLALPAQAAKADASSVDGTYTGTGTGRNGDITLSVTIADGKITQIENISNKETPKYWAEAVKLFDSILAANGTDGVDAVSGATLSSDGILAAVDDALAKASSQLSGSGTAFLEIDGSTVEYDLERGQSMIVDTGYLAAMDDTCTMEIVSVPGVKNKLFGGEGLFNTVVHGPGHIILQSMPISAVASCLSPFFPSGSN